MIDSTWYQRPPGVPARQAAGGVIVRTQGDHLLVALVREGPQAAYILPKGHVEKGEAVETAARREIEEEAGLHDLRLLAELGVRERLDFARTEWKVTHYYLFLTGQVDGQPTDPSHDYRLEWFPLDHLPAMFWPEQRALLEQNLDRIAALVAEVR